MKSGLRSWEDLREAKTRRERGGGPIYWNFETLPDMVLRINWNADPEQLTNARPLRDEVPFRVVTKLDGSDVDAIWGRDTEPNRQIYKYLKEKEEGRARNTGRR